MSEGTLVAPAPVAVAAARRPVARRRAELPLVGRAAELAALALGPRRPSGRTGASLVIEGEAGIGKSRLRAS